VPAIALAAMLAFAVPTASWGAGTAATAHTGSIPTAVSTSSGLGGGVSGGGSTTSTALDTALQRTTNRWAAATVGAQNAASLELSSDTAVMAIGGFTGSDASPTLAQLKAYVAAGDIHYFVVSNGGGGAGSSPGAAPTGTRPSGAPSGRDGGGSSSGTSSAITAWVKANFTATTIGGQTVYDLTSSK
jgi:hypothetical protein